MSRLDELKGAVTGLWEKIQESEAYQQIKAKYDEFDQDTKLYIQLGSVAGLALLVVLSVLTGIAKVNSLKADMDQREELIGYLQRSSDTIKRLRAQQENRRTTVDSGEALPIFVENVQRATGLDRVKLDLGKERIGLETKETKETLVDVKISQSNLRMVTRLLFELTQAGAPRNLIVKDLMIDTQNDLNGFMDATFTLAGYSAK